MLKITHEKPKSFYSEFDRKEGDQHLTHYCPGCGHGVLHKLIAEAIDDFGLQNRTVLVSPVGCSVFAFHYFDVGNVQAAHGRATAVATGIKRSRPESIVISYQGDGDLAAIGTAEIVHAANRGENFTAFFINNAIYGMTGGQMAPTTLIGQKTNTTPFGRDSAREGFPLRICEMLSTLDGPTYIERVALTGPKTNMKARQAIRKAIRNQMENRGFSLIEVLSPCPTGWKVRPDKASRWIEEVMLPYFPLGVYKDISAERENCFYRCPQEPQKPIPEILEIPVAEEGTSPARHDSLAPFDLKEIKIAGFGGQGVLYLGVLMATAGMMQGLRTSWLPSYGPEMRGGTANCNVVLSRREIGTPLVEYPDVLIALNGPSLDRFQNKVKTGGSIIYDSSLISSEGLQVRPGALGVPLSQMAHELGEPKVANLIALGALMGKESFISDSVVDQAIEETLEKVNLRALNKKAFQAGFAFARQATI
jgi:2-oxoisovalerate ferredoxin oxidoreductase beta subunit